MRHLSETCVGGCTTLETKQARWTCSGVALDPLPTPGYVSAASYGDNACSTSTWGETVEILPGSCATPHDAHTSQRSTHSFFDMLLFRGPGGGFGSFKVDCDADGIKFSVYEDTSCKDSIGEIPISPGTCEEYPKLGGVDPVFIKASCPSKVLNGGSTTDPAGPGDRNHTLIIVVGILLVLGLGIGAGVIIFIRRRRASSSAVNVLNINTDEDTFDDEFTNDAEF